MNTEKGTVTLVSFQSYGSREVYLICTTAAVRVFSSRSAAEKWRKKAAASSKGTMTLHTMWPQYTRNGLERDIVLPTGEPEKDASEYPAKLEDLAVFGIKAKGLKCLGDKALAWHQQEPW